MILLTQIINTYKLSYPFALPTQRKNIESVQFSELSNVNHLPQALQYKYLSQQVMRGAFQPRSTPRNSSKQVKPTTMYSKPELAVENFAKGKEYQESSSFQKAIEEYHKALMYDPNYFQAYCNMGSCYRAQGKYLEARSMYMKAINIKSDDAISHYNLANTLRIIGNYEDSVKHYEFVIKLGERGSTLGSLYPNSLINLGICYKQIRQYEKSIQCFQQARKIDLNDDSIIFNEAMTYMAMLEAINTDLFYEVAKQKAQKADMLLKQILKVNPNNQMAVLKLSKISTILDKSNKNLKIVVSKLQTMLQNESSNLKKQINQQLGYVLNLLKQYEKSAKYYQQSVKKPSKKSINIYDTDTGFVHDKTPVISEQYALSLIKQDKLQEVNEILVKMDDSDISKHVVELALQLHLSQIHPKMEQYFENAIKIYQKHFFIDKKEISDEKISIEAHKLIGKLLSLENKFKESIRHFEYISSQLKGEEISKVRSSLGNDYQALGDTEKALEQYKLALSQDPNNYEIVYNIGCCLHNEGNLDESSKYFEKFLSLIKKDNRVYLPTKNLYIADCLMTMASTAFNKPDEFKIHESAWTAFKQSQEGQQEQNIELQTSKFLDFCLRWADLLEEKITKISDKKSEDYIKSREILLETYTEMLQIQACPDRDAILNNCAIIYYEEKLYTNALSNLNQISYPSGLSLNSLALTYFHLGEHIMAQDTMNLAFEKQPNDEVILFNKQIIEWVYGIKKQGRIQKIFKNNDENLVIARWQFGVLLIDAFSQNLKSRGNEIEAGEINQIIEKLLQDNDALNYLNETEQIKFKHLHNLLKSTTSKQNVNQIPENLLRKCVNPSQNIETDLKLLLYAFETSKQTPEAFIQSLLSIFIFVNKQKSTSIHSILAEYSQTKTQTIQLQLDKKVSITPNELTKQYNFQSTDDLVINFCSWQCELEPKIATILQTIQNHYYKSQFRHLLEIQYHFPRHTRTEVCSQTFNKMLSLIYRTFRTTINDEELSGNINEMKCQILRNMDYDFEARMQSSSFNFTMSLNQKQCVATIYANFMSKSQCVLFINNLKRQSSTKSILIDENCEQLVLIVSGVVRIICVWNEKKPLLAAIKSLLRSPLKLHEQAIIEIDSDLQMIKESSQKAAKILSSINEFDY